MNIGNARSLPFQGSVNQAAVRRAADAIAQLGRSLPCRVTAVSGSIVSVKFEVNAAPWLLPPVTIPKGESQWIRSPTQIGDFGFTVPADVYLGGISGLGGGTADMSRRSPLTALVWVPVGATGFPDVNTNAACIYGPDGAVIRDSGSNSVFTLLPTQQTFQVGPNVTATLTETEISLAVGSMSVVVTAAGIALNGPITQTEIGGSGAVTMIGPLTVTNEVTGNGIHLSAHVHSGVTRGGGDTDAPVPGT